MQDFQKRIGSEVLGPNHSGKIVGGKIWIFVEVIFFDPSAVTLHFEDLATKITFFFVTI